MTLSKLQRYIIKESYLFGRPRIPRRLFSQFYQSSRISKSSQAKIITKSLERLIDKGLIIGIGQKSQYKLVIEQIKLTPQGRKQARRLMGEQKTLPIFARKKVTQ